MPSNPLMDLFMAAWTTSGFATSMGAAPHAMLAKHNLAVGRAIAVKAFGWREATRHLCWTCQLAVPGVYVSLGEARRRKPLSKLDQLFTRASDPAFRKGAVANPRETFDALGLSVTPNVRLVIRARSAAPSLELQLCEAHHACLCAAPDLEPIVFKNWPHETD